MELADYLLPLRKWWWLLLASVFIASISSFVAVNHQPATYKTHATLMVGSAIENPNPTGSDFWLMQQLANTYADIAKREPVRQATMDALGLTWLPDYTVRVVPNTQLIEIAVTDTDQVRAQAVANELANQIIKQSPTGNGTDQQRQAFIEQQLNELEKGIDDTKDQIDQKQEELASMFSARQIADTKAQIHALQDKLSTLQANYAALLANTERGAVNTLTIIEPAIRPESPVGPNKPMTVLLASIIGFILAAMASYLLDYLDDTIKTPEEVKKLLNLTTLSAVPRIHDFGSELIVINQSQSPAVESYRILRTNLQFAAVNHPLDTLLITSPSPTEGKSITVANLAIAMAQAGKKTIIVDGDLHRPRQHRLFSLPNTVGVTTALLSEHPRPDGLLKSTQIPNLQILTSGPLPPNPAELLGSERMKELLQYLTKEADTIILDSPPATILSDAMILSTQSDGVLLVLDVDRTRRDAARRVVEGLQQVNARVVGVLLNRVPTKGGGYYYYYSRDYISDDNHRGPVKKLWRRRKKHKRRSSQHPNTATAIRPVQTSTASADPNDAEQML